jgi:uncharacterized membrane protein
MNLKRTFGAILTTIGIIGLIYAGISIMQHSAKTTPIIVVGILGMIFFFSGIGLIKTTADQVK